MELIEQYWTCQTPQSYASMVTRVATAARNCYQAEGKKRDLELIRQCIQSGHFSILEHVSITVTITTDRGVTHELVRHRLASYSQESTRWCNYAKLGIKFIHPVDFDLDEADRAFLQLVEDQYESSIKKGRTPQQARYFLINGLKTTIVMTMNLREYRLLFQQRALGLTGKPHPQMEALMLDMLDYFAREFPVFFRDLVTVYYDV